MSVKCGVLDNRRMDAYNEENMQPLEEGILPDIAIDMTENDQSKHRDTLIEKAFEILSE